MTRALRIFLFMSAVAILGSCSRPQDDPAVPETSAGKETPSSLISSLFEPSAAEKAQAEQMKNRQLLLQQQNEQMQKDRLQSY